MEFKGPATCTDSYGTVENITFPYTFPEGSCDVYTITYNTKPDRPLGESSVKNKAVLKKIRLITEIRQNILCGSETIIL